MRDGTTGRPEEKIFCAKALGLEETHVFREWKGKVERDRDRGGVVGLRAPPEGCVGWKLGEFEQGAKSPLRQEIVRGLKGHKKESSLQREPCSATHNHLISTHLVHSVLQHPHTNFCYALGIYVCL